MTAAARSSAVAAAEDDSLDVMVAEYSWSMSPTALIRDSAISTGAKTLYMVMHSYLNASHPGSYPGHELLATHLGCSDRQVRRYQAELVTAGWIRVDQRFTRSGKRTSNLYRLLASARPPATDSVSSADSNQNGPVVSRSTVSAGDNHRTLMSGGSDQGIVDNWAEADLARKAGLDSDSATAAVFAGDNHRTLVSGGFDQGIVDNSRKSTKFESKTQRSDLRKGSVLADGNHRTPVSYELDGGLNPHQPPPAASGSLVVVEDDGDSAGITEAAVDGRPHPRPDPARRLALAVRSGLPPGLASQVASGPLQRACGPLVSAGVAADSLQELTRRRQWAGAGPGAVITWLRDDAIRELAAARDAAAGAPDRRRGRDFRSWAASQPECPHGTPGGAIPRPVEGTPSCAICRHQAAGQAGRKTG